MKMKIAQKQQKRCNIDIQVDINSCSYPECQAQGPIAVLYSPVEIRSCDEHWSELYKFYLTGKGRVNVNLGQTVDKWSNVDQKTGNHKHHRITVGKDWEIKNRTISKEDKNVVVNRVTGKEAQY